MWFSFFMDKIPANSLKQRTAILVSAIFACLTYILPVWAIPSISIPSEYGNIKESSDSGFSALSKKTIVCIQDAHCNYEAQKNMSKLLEHLVKENKLKLIMVEGGSGNVNLSFLRMYADKQTRERIADKYLQMGQISGEEYLDITSDYNLELYGVEDEWLYNEHMAVFEKVDSIKEKGLSELEPFSALINGLKPYIYPKEAVELEKKRADYDAKLISLTEYCQYLKEKAQAKNLGLENYPHLTAFSDTNLLEKDIDFKLVELERNLFIKDLAKLLDEAGIEELLKKSQDFKAGKIAPQEYYAFLQKSAEGKINIEENYPYLPSYFSYISLNKEIDAAILIKELNSIEDQLRTAYFSNDDQKRLSAIAKTAQIVTSLLNLELLPEDYAYFEANKPDFATASWVDFLGKNCRKYKLGVCPAPAKDIDDNLDNLGQFYRLGLEREKAFVDNMLNKINKSSDKVIALITGGFHTAGVTKMLKDMDYSYVVVAPVITQESNSNIYFSVLKGQKEQPDEALYIEED